MSAPRYLLAALVFSAFTLSAQQQQRGAARGATIASASLLETISISELSSMMARIAAHERALPHNLTVSHTRRFSS